mgnify:FL=1
MEKQTISYIPYHNIGLLASALHTGVRVFEGTQWILAKHQTELKMRVPEGYADWFHYYDTAIKGLKIALHHLDKTGEMSP